MADYPTDGALEALVAKQGELQTRCVTGARRSKRALQTVIRINSTILSEDGDRRKALGEITSCVLDLCILEGISFEDLLTEQVASIEGHTHHMEELRAAGRLDQSVLREETGNHEASTTPDSLREEKSVRTNETARETCCRALTGTAKERAEICAQRLREKGWQILAHDWEIWAGKLDVVARTGSTLVIVAVNGLETGSVTKPASAADEIEPKERRRFRRLASAWIATYGRTVAFREVRFDVVTVGLTSDGSVSSFDHIENAF